jgi:acetolactate synthase I/II/III large subunit
MILFVGQVPRAFRGREAFQEIDYRAMFGSIAKWVVEIEQASRVPELVARAFRVALSGRPGPVVVSLPEDVLTETSDVPDAAALPPVQPAPAPGDVDRARELLAGARRPLLIVGGSGWTPCASDRLRSFAEASRLPVATSVRRQDLVDNRSPSFAGALGLNAFPYLPDRIEEADLVFLLGTRVDSLSTAGYTLLAAPRPHQVLIHSHASPDVLGRVYEPDLAINASSAELVRALAEAPVDGHAWADWTDAIHRDFESCQESAFEGAVELSDVLRLLCARLPDAILASGAGNYTMPVHRYWRFTRYPSQAAPQAGSMGYGMPAAVAAKVAEPDRPVVAVAGDGCFLMNGQELATAVQHGLQVLVVIINNGMYGTIQAHQERSYPGRPYGTALRNPDFADLARAYGAHGEVVEQTQEFEPALERALAAGGPALIEIRV